MPSRNHAVARPGCSEARYFRAALTTYQAVRAWNLAFIQSLTDEQKAQVVTHPERGTMTVWTIVETMAGHDRHHLAGLEKLENVLAS